MRTPALRDPSPGGSRDRPELLVPLAIFAFALAAYLAFLTVHHSYDAVAGGILLYQWMALGSVEQLFHRYHVLYLPAAAGAELALNRIGVEVDPLTLLQLLSAPFAAASVAVYQRLARALGLEAWLSVTCALLLGGGFSYWYYATNGESYPVSIFFLLLAFLSAARMPEHASWVRSAAPGAWLGLAACFHATSVLALPGLVVLSWPRESAGRGYRRAAASIAAAVLVIGLPHAARYALLRSDPASGISADAGALAREEGWTLRPRVVDEWRGLVRSMVPRDWPALPSRYSRLTRVAELGLLVATLLPLALSFGLDRERRRPVLAVFVWLTVTFVFFSMYFPGSPKFASYQWAPLLLLIGFAVQKITRRGPVRRVAAPVLALLVGTILFCSFDLVRRQTDPASNPHLARARAIGRLTQPGDLVVHLGRGDDQYQNVYTPYFAVRRSLSLDQCVGRSRASPSLQAIEIRLASAVGASGRVVVLAAAVEPGAASRDFERAHELPEGSIARLFAAYGPRLMAQDPAVGNLWLVDR